MNTLQNMQSIQIIQVILALAAIIISCGVIYIQGKNIEKYKKYDTDFLVIAVFLLAISAVLSIATT